MSREIFSKTFVFLAALAAASQSSIKNNNYESSDRERWRNEIISSLKLNIFGCEYQISDKYFQDTTSTSVIQSDLLKVFINFPGIHQAQLYRKLPVTYSSANERILKIVNCPRLVEWVNEKNLRWMIPDNHVGQNRTLCVGLTKLLGHGNVVALYEQYKIIKTISYLITGSNALIHSTGQVMFKCGTYQGKEACETRFDGKVNDWRNDCKKTVEDLKFTWDTFLTQISNPRSVNSVEMLTKCSDNMTAPVRHDRVMVITAVHDNNFHHILSDSLARLAVNMWFVRRNTDVMIHMRVFEITRDPGYTLTRTEVFISTKSRKAFFELIGIDHSRIIYGPVIANTVYVPRVTSCSYLLDNPLEIRMLSRELTKSAKKFMRKRKQRESKRNENSFDIDRNIHPNTIYYQADDVSLDRKKRNIVVLQRQGFSSAWGEREWSEGQWNELNAVLATAFPNHHIVRHPSRTILHDDYCLACEITEMANADIMIAMHGAGMSKEMFMRQGGLVVEVSGHYNDAQMPVCGYYGNLASIFGLHHYLYGYDFENGNKDPDTKKDIQDKLNPRDLVKEIKTYWNLVSNPLRSPSMTMIDKSLYPYN